MITVYMKVSFSHHSFTTGKIAIVAMQTDKEAEHIGVYKDLAKEKICKELGFDQKELVIFDYKFLGENVMFI